MIAVYVFILGLMFGSFFNVVGMRLSNNESIVFPGSHCEKCNHKLKWYENIPLFSYILLKGKCSHCHTKISVWYPATELFTGMLFLISYYTFGISLEFLIAIILSSLTTIIFVSDINYYIILDSPIIIGSIIIIIIKLFMEPFINVLYSIGSGILIFAIMYTIIYKALNMADFICLSIFYENKLVKGVWGKLWEYEQSEYSLVLPPTKYYNYLVIT